jgi:hypothetical protein
MASTNCFASLFMLKPITPPNVRGI